MKSQGTGNYTKIVPIPKSHFEANNAVMIAGFPSPGMIGSIVCNHLIEPARLASNRVYSFEVYHTGSNMGRRQASASLQNLL